MQEMYQNFEEGEEWQLPDERDPFTESENTEILIGCVDVYLESIGYMVRCISLFVFCISDGLKSAVNFFSFLN